VNVSIVEQGKVEKGRRNHRLEREKSHGWAWSIYGEQPAAFRVGMMIRQIIRKRPLCRVVRNKAMFETTVSSGSARNVHNTLHHGTTDSE